METLTEALERLDRRGYADSFRAEPRGLQALGAKRLYRPEELFVDEIVRFEGESDPQDQAVLFALRSRDGVRGCFITGFGPPGDPDSAEAVRGLVDARPTRAGD